MSAPVRDIVIVGGGTAGWLAASSIAARAGHGATRFLSVTVVEAPDIPTIGVGEGTWPTMRATLAAIGLSEARFLAECDASFKQGSRFDGWVSGENGDSYLHPFTPPPPAAPAALVEAWRIGVGPYAAAVTGQAQVCAHDLAPRQAEMPDYAGALNYAYHLDAGKFATLLRQHAVESLGVRHIADRVIGVESTADGDIGGIRTSDNGLVNGDLFIDCSGQAALLIGAHYAVPWIERGDVLFNDRALAVQVLVAEGSPVASQTIATAHEGGWIWDIGLPARRGIGCVYSSRFLGDDRAEEILRDYLAKSGFEEMVDLPIRRLGFATGHRAQFWHRNCIALGMASGFIEPLEASAIVMIELGLEALLSDFPHDREAMDLRAMRYNSLFSYRWDRIVEFLKLHYVLSRRDEAYWRAHRDQAHWPERMADLLRLWRDRPPTVEDFPQHREIFSAESHQYVLYGMGFPPPKPGPLPVEGADGARRQLALVEQRARHLVSALPSNRDYLAALRGVDAAAISQPARATLP